jgi:phosphatidylserine/phosphatidylglycerophosphate/cardiolipin synthase-like enzyme
VSKDAYNKLEFHIQNFCTRATTAQIQYAVLLLGGLPVLNAETISVLGASFTSSPTLRQYFIDILSHAGRNLPDLPPSAIAVTLSALAHQRDAADARMQIETVWTGPGHSSSQHRKAAQALYDIIDDAKEELLIVSFVAYRVEPLLTRLHKAVARGVRVRLLLESSMATGGKLSHDSIAASGLADIPGAEIWIWPEAKRKKDASGNTGTLHAKCAIADRRHALVTSANLTGHALHLNIELGVKINGGEIPLEIALQFERMMEKGDVERVGGIF